MWCYFLNCNYIPNVTLIGFRLRCGTLNSNQSNESSFRGEPYSVRTGNIVYIRVIKT